MILDSLDLPIICLQICKVSEKNMKFWIFKLISKLMNIYFQFSQWVQNLMNIFKNQYLSQFLMDFGPQYLILKRIGRATRICQGEGQGYSDFQKSAQLEVGGLKNTEILSFIYLLNMKVHQFSFNIFFKYTKYIYIYIYTKF